MSQRASTLPWFLVACLVCINISAFYYILKIRDSQQHLAASMKELANAISDAEVPADKEALTLRVETVPAEASPLTTSTPPHDSVATATLQDGERNEHMHKALRYDDMPEEGKKQLPRTTNGDYYFQQPNGRFGLAWLTGDNKDKPEVRKLVTDLFYASWDELELRLAHVESELESSNYIPANSYEDAWQLAETMFDGGKRKAHVQQYQGEWALVDLNGIDQEVLAEAQESAKAAGKELKEDYGIHYELLVTPDLPLAEEE